MLRRQVDSATVVSGTIWSIAAHTSDGSTQWYSTRGLGTLRGPTGRSRGPPEKWGIVYFHHLIHYRREPNVRDSEMADYIDNRFQFLHSTVVDNFRILVLIISNNQNLFRWRSMRGILPRPMWINWLVLNTAKGENCWQGIIMASNKSSTHTQHLISLSWFHLYTVHVICNHF